MAKRFSRTRSALSHSYHSLRIMTALFVAFLSLMNAQVCSGDWVRFFKARPSDLPGVPFGLSSTAESDEGLSASGWYRYIQGSNPTVLHGKKETSGDFRPIVTYEVATEGKGKWKTIRADFEQPRLDSITVSPEHPGVTLSMNMEPFRKAIGIYRYGRLVLENGDAAMFAVDDLLPTEDESGDGNGDFKTDVIQTDEAKKSKGFEDAWLGGPANLLTITSLGGRLVGDFIFEARSAKAISLDGNRTLDGDFWPKVTFQIANSDRRWKTIGKSQNNGTSTVLQIPSGKAERTRVLLNDYKPLIGKYKYGKVVFSDGSFAVFSIENLNPGKD